MSSVARILFACVVLPLLPACGGNPTGPDSPPEETTVAAAFDYFHQESESIYDGNGTWGHARYGYRMALRDSYWRADVYGHLGAQASAPAIYRRRSQEVIDYLLDTQRQGETGVFGFPADVNNPEFGALIEEILNICPDDCIHNGWVITLPGGAIAELYYDHGYALTAVARAYQRTGDAALLVPIRWAADWALDKPLTANLNYLSALSKGLCHAYEATGDERYLNRAITLHQDGILPFLNSDGEATDPHNARLEYHGFIVSGLIALRRSLPTGHALVPTLDTVLAAALARMASRDLVETADYGATWPGTNLLAWHELSRQRSLSPVESQAVERISMLMRGYVDDMKAEQNGFRLQKALYSNFFVGLVL